MLSNSSNIISDSLSEQTLKGRLGTKEIRERERESLILPLRAPSSQCHIQYFASSPSDPRGPRSLHVADSLLRRVRMDGRNSALSSNIVELNYDHEIALQIYKLGLKQFCHFPSSFSLLSASSLLLVEQNIWRRGAKLELSRG